MADGIEPFDAMRNFKRVAAGWRGSKFFQKMVLAPVRNFVEGWPPEVSQEMQDTEKASHATPYDAWNSRR